MLSRKVTGSFVCLRCRLQLASVAARACSTRGQRPFGFSFASSTSAVSATTITRHTRLYSTKPDADAPVDSDPPMKASSEDPFAQLSEAIATDKKKPKSTGIASWDEPPKAEESIKTEESLKAIKDIESDGSREAPGLNDDIPIRRVADGSQHSSHRKSEPRIMFRKFNLAENKAYSAHERAVKAVRKDLKLDRLGKPAAALVLQEAIKFRSMKELEPELPEQVDLQKSMLLSALDLESENALVNIHELRPDELVLSGAEFSSLVSMLASSFTKHQLLSYQIQYHKIERFQTEDSLTDSPYPWTIATEEWAPETPNSSTVERSLAGYVGESTLPKEKIAVRLVRECWNISCTEVNNGRGSLSIRVRDPYFSILTLGTRKHLNDITRNFLRPGDSIEVDQTTRSVTIHASRSIAETAVQKINGVLERTRSVTYDSKAISAEKIPVEALEKVGQITNSVVRYGRDDNQVR